MFRDIENIGRLRWVLEIPGKIKDHLDQKGDGESEEKIENEKSKDVPPVVLVGRNVLRRLGRLFASGMNPCVYSLSISLGKMRPDREVWHKA